MPGRFFHHRPLFCLLLPLLLVGCRETDPAVQIAHIAELPLWQKAGALTVMAVFSEDLACIVAGILASEEVMTFGWAFLAALVGTFLGDLPTYALGRLGGIAMLRRRPFRWFLKEERIVQAEEVFSNHVVKIIFSSRLLPGSRLPIYAAAGVLNYPFWKFFGILAIASSLSTLALVWVSMRLGEIVFDWLRVYEAYALPAGGALVFVIWLVVKSLETVATRRSRLVFLARSRRMVGWPPRRTRD